MNGPIDTWIVGSLTALAALLGTGCPEQNRESWDVGAETSEPTIRDREFPVPCRRAGDHYFFFDDDRVTGFWHVPNGQALTLEYDEQGRWAGTVSRDCEGSGIELSYHTAHERFRECVRDNDPDARANYRFEQGRVAGGTIEWIDPSRPTASMTYSYDSSGRLAKIRRETKQGGDEAIGTELVWNGNSVELKGRGLGSQTVTFDSESSGEMGIWTCLTVFGTIGQRGLCRMLRDDAPGPIVEFDQGGAVQFQYIWDEGRIQHMKDDSHLSRYHYTCSTRR